MMVFIPRILLREKMALRQAMAAVDAKSARSIYFQSQSILEEATGEPCWGERGYVLVLCVAAAFLILASAYLVMAHRNWLAIVVVALAGFAAVRLEALAVRHLTPLLFGLLFGTLSLVIATESAWLKLLLSALLLHFFSFAYAARVTFLMMMRNDRAYAALYGALRIRFTGNP